MVENKKVKNTVATFYNNINFKSKLEVSCYKKLEASGLPFSYESDTIILWEGEEINNIVVYDLKGKKDKLLTKRNKGYKLRNITYTPDFRVDYKGHIIYFDVKGHVNDIYPIKKKMFIQLLDNDGKKFMFFEPHNVRQMTQAIEIINNL